MFCGGEARRRFAFGKAVGSSLVYSDGIKVPADTIGDGEEDTVEVVAVEIVEARVVVVVFVIVDVKAAREKTAGEHKEVGVLHWVLQEGIPCVVDVPSFNKLVFGVDSVVESSASHIEFVTEGEQDFALLFRAPSLVDTTVM